MPLPLMLAVYSASTVSSVATPLVFDWLTVLSASIASAIASGTGVFLLTHSNRPSVLPNQSETILNDITFLVRQTTQETSNLSESLSQTDNIIQNSVNTLDSHLNVLSEHNQYINTPQLPFNLLNTSLLEQSCARLNLIITTLESEHQSLLTQHSLLTETIEQLNIVRTQCQIEQNNLYQITQTLINLSNTDTTLELSQCMEELRQEKALNQEMYTTIEELLAENISMQQRLNPQNNDDTENNRTFRVN